MAVNQIKAGALLSYLSLGLVTFIGLIYTPFMLRMLGQSEYGLYSLVGSVVSYLTILDLGFGSAVIRYTAQIRVQGKKDEQYSLFGMIMLLYIGIGVIAFLAGLGLYFNMENLFGRSMTTSELDRAKIMMLILISNIAITFPLSIFSSILQAYERFVFQKSVNITRTLINPLIMTLLLLLGYKAIALVVLITILNIGSLLFFAWYCFNKLKIKIVFKQMNFSLLKEIVGFSAFIFLNIIVGQIYWNSGPFILGSVQGTAAVAIFAIAIQLCTYYNNFSFAITGVFLPKLTLMIANNATPKEVSDLFIKIGRIQFIIIAFILSGFILFGQSFINLWAGADYSTSYPIALILMIPSLIALSQNIGTIILQARNQLKFYSILQFSVAICSILISIPLSRFFSGIGCAVGTSVALILGNIIILNIYYYKEVKIDIPLYWVEILKMSLPIISVMLVMVAINFVSPKRNFLFLSLNILIYTAIYITIIWWKVMNSYERQLFGGPLNRLLNKISSH